MKRILDWATTIPFLLAFGLTLVVFDPIQRISRLFGRRPHEKVVGFFQRTLIASFRITGMELTVERSGGILPHQGYILVANHQSMFDIPIFGGILLTNYPKYVAKKELAHWIPSVSFNLRRGGNAIIDRTDRTDSLRTLRRLGEECQERNVAVVIYPEGSRSRDGKLREFRPGGTIALMQAAPDLPIVPTVIDGSWRLLASNLMPVPFGTKVRIRFGDPLSRTGNEDHGLILKQVRAEIEQTLEEWRQD